VTSRTARAGWTGALVLAALAALLAGVQAYRAWTDPALDAGEEGHGAQPAAAEADLAGTVLDAASDLGIPGAEVSLRCEAGGRRASRTDGRGAYAFTGLPEGDCTLAATAPGFAASGRRREAELSVRVRPGLPLADADLVLHRSAQVAGTVRLYGQPVAGARLSALYLESPGEGEPFSLELEAPSGADGSYRLEELGPGRMQVVAELDPHPPAESQEVFLRGGERLDGLDVELGAAASLAVSVRDEARRPLSGVELVLLAEGRRGALRAASDQAGQALFERIPPGAFRLTARLAGYAPPPPREGRLETGQRLELSLVLAGVPGLSGTVVDRGGAPVPGAAVFALPDGQVGPEVPAAYARSGGAFFVPGPFATERLRLWASHPEHGPSDPVRVRLGDGPVTLVLGEPGSLAGRVVSSAGGQPVPQFSVLLSRARAPGGGGIPFTQRAVRDPAGRFELARLAPGEYMLEVQAPGVTPARRAGVSVLAGRRTELGDLALGPGGEFVGQVVDERTGAPLSGVSVRHGTGGLVRSAGRTGPDGRFRVAAAAERLSLEFSRPGYVTEMLTGQEVPAGGERDLGVVRLEPDDGDGRGAFRYGGMGAQLSFQDGRLRVGEVFPDSPAAGAGLPDGAEILRIDGIDVSELDLARAVELIRGEPGSELRLDVLLPGASHPQSLLVTRQRLRSR